MANKIRDAQLSIDSQIKFQPYKFSFEQAVFVLQNLYPQKNIYFTSANRCYIAGSEIQKISIEEKNITICSDRMSLTSLNSPLPETQLDILRLLNWVKNDSLQNFLDIFHNRLAELSYSVFRKQSYSFQKKDFFEDTNLGECVSALSGECDGYPIHKFAFLFWNRPHSALGLRLILESYFNCHVEVEQFVGKYTNIEDKTTLGRKNNELGICTVLSNMFFDYSAKIRIVFYDLEKELFLYMQKGKPGYKAAKKIIDSYIDITTDYSVEFLPKYRFDTQLGRDNSLGHFCWLHI